MRVPTRACAACRARCSARPCALPAAPQLITHQYVPFNNTLVFNGIDSSAATYEL